MVKNEGPLDRLVRAVLGVALVLLAYLMNMGVASWIIGIIGGIVIITAITGFCGLYKVLGISTVKEEKPSSTEEA